MNDAISANTPYYQLDPDTVINAVESVGMACDGRLLPLNSYENRVYQVGRETGDPMVAKFYRPGRWSDEQILEEHAFALELAEAEIPLVPPMTLATGTLNHFEGFRFALFERRGGHAPELDDKETRTWLGRFLGRIHAVGSSRGLNIALSSRPSVSDRTPSTPSRAVNGCPPTSGPPSKPSARI